MSVEGLKGLARALAKHRRGKAKNLRKGLYRAGLFLQRESQKIVPVEFGVLKNSANTRMEGKDLRVAAIISYGTDYAIFVHEIKENKHKPGKQAKFLETPLREKRGRIREIVVNTLKEDVL